MANIVIMPNFVEAFCRRLPRGIHPSGQAWICEYLYQMQDADSAEVLRLAARVCAIVARELRYLAENKETFGGPMPAATCAVRLMNGSVIHRQLMSNYAQAWLVTSAAVSIATSYLNRLAKE